MRNENVRRVLRKTDVNAIFVAFVVISRLVTRILSLMLSAGSIASYPIVSLLAFYSVLLLFFLFSFLWAHWLSDRIGLPSTLFYFTVCFFLHLVCFLFGYYLEDVGWGCAAERIVWQ